MLELCQLWSEDFHADALDNVGVSGGKSNAGIAALVNGQVDLAQSFQEDQTSEIEAAQANGVNPVEFKVAIDGMAINPHTDNPVDVLTVEQLRVCLPQRSVHQLEPGGRERRGYNALWAPVYVGTAVLLGARPEEG
ncbi:MAG: substrate-binding domain-containing protein [Chromatiales bacterium]|nr:substrate-binding domain-containing protein [Chromatiales bacterium]